MYDTDGVVAKSKFFTWVMFFTKPMVVSSGCLLYDVIWLLGGGSTG